MVSSAESVDAISDIYVYSVRNLKIMLTNYSEEHLSARAVFFNRLGEIRDRRVEQQRYRAIGLNLVTAAIELWNTTCLKRATRTLATQATTSDENPLQILSPLASVHINLAGDNI